MEKGILMEALSLSAVEAEAYLKIVESKGVRASTVARMVDVARPKIYEILGRLIERGLIIEVKEGVANFYPVRPDLALDQIRSEARSNWQRRDHQVEELRDRLLKAYDRRGVERRGYKIVRIWTGIDEITRRMALLNETRETLEITFRRPIVSDPTSNEIRDTIMGAARRGIKVRLLWELELTRIPEIQAHWRTLEIPLEMRWTKDLDLRLALFDGSRVLVADPGEVTDFEDLPFEEYDQELVVGLLSRKFAKLWDSAHPIPLPCPQDWTPE